MKRKYRIFCDFDGTVALNDVGNIVFTKFGNAEHWWKLVEDWRQGKFDAREMWRRQAKVSNMKSDDLKKFAKTQKLDPYFPSFVDFCRNHDLPLYIVSDGMDAYIKPILEHHGFSGLDVRSNRLSFDEGNYLKVDFPYYELGCGSCANCKGYHVKRETKTDEVSVYIGDGYSDTCGAVEADIIFAKNDLLTVCEEKSIDCHPYKTFHDVILFFKQNF